MTASTNSSLQQCPISSTHQRLRQAHILWHQAAESYQDVDRFLTNINSLIQELRNITFILQSEKSKFQDFETWYQPWQEKLKNDKYAKWIKDARNLVVKQGTLIAASHFNVRFLAYESIDVVCLLSENDLTISTVLRRDDFINIVVRLRNMMEAQGDAVLSIERCWSTPDLTGEELLKVLGEQYGVLASIVLDAHVHLGHLECTSGINEELEDSDFPSQHGHSHLLPCMMRANASRTDFFKLSNLEQMFEGTRPLLPRVTDSDVVLRYQLTDAEKIGAFETIDPLKYYEHIVYSSKKVLRKDRSLARIMLLRDGRGRWSSYMIMAADRVEKYLLMHLLAQTIREEGCDALIEVGEVWIVDQDKIPLVFIDATERIPNRQEAISVRLATREGLRRNTITPFKRGPFGGIRVGDATELENDEVNYLKPIFQVWREQTQFDLTKGLRTPIWHPEISAQCLCGNDLPFGVCCLPILDGPDGPLQNSDDLLKAGHTKLAERHARAKVTQYARWVRQHTAFSLNSSSRDFAERMIPTDCLAMEACMAKLERWAIKTANYNAVSRTYQRLQEFVGVPVITRRLIALGARWMILTDRPEEGLIELARLGRPSEMKDTYALMLAAEYGDTEDEVRLLRGAVSFALSDEERHSALICLSDALQKHGLQSEALASLDDVLKQSSDPMTIRAAMTLRWQISNTDDDFANLVSLMQSEKAVEDRLGAASFLLSQRKGDAALEILKPLLDDNNPFANLIAVECEIISGHCSAGFDRLASLEVNETSDIDMRSGFAFMQAKLVLDCGREDLLQSATQSLQAVLSVKPNPDLTALLNALSKNAQ